MNFAAVGLGRTSRSVVAGVALSAVFGVAGCSAKDDAPPVASVTLGLSKKAAALGSPVDMTYRFEVAAGARIDGDYRVFVQLIDADGVRRWSDDHNPSIKTSDWKPGQRIEYTRTPFLPLIPYLGEATIRVGLYRTDAVDARLPLSGPEPEGRSYHVATLQLLPQSENIFVWFPSGWHQPEFAKENPGLEWSWTKKQGTFKFANPKRDVTIFLESDARPDAFDQAQQVSVYLGSQVIATFAADNTLPVLRRFPLSAAQMGTDAMLEFRLEVDRAFVPAKTPGVGDHDSRELGIRVYHLFIEAP